MINVEPSSNDLPVATPLSGETQKKPEQGGHDLFTQRAVTLLVVTGWLGMRVYMVVAGVESKITEVDLIVATIVGYWFGSSPKSHD